MPSQRPLTLSPTELAYLYGLLSSIPPLRPDQRSPTTFRPLVAETDLLPFTNGSARLCFIDGIEVIVGVKAEVERTEGDDSAGDSQGNRHDEEDIVGADIQLHDVPHQAAIGHSRWVEVAIDLPVQRDDDSTLISLAQMIHEGLVCDGSLQRRLSINQKWHWRLHIDIFLLSTPASYPLPLLSLSTHLALLSTRLPALISQGEEDPLFNDDWEAANPLYPKLNTKQGEKDASHAAKPPVSIMVASVGLNIFLDPSTEELAVADAVIVITLTATSTGGARVLAIRMLDPPAVLTTSSSAALGGEPGFGKMEEGEGIWKPKRGGIKRSVLSQVVDLCSKKGGMGEEVLRGLEGFV